MAVAEPTLRKAPKILSIVDSRARKPPAQLLDLPREIRDAIWASVLTSPPLLDRKHVTTCPMYNPTADYVTPPAPMLYSCPRDYTKQLGTRLFAKDDCTKSCIRRKGLQLLRVSRQLHSEAMEVWSEQGIHVTFFDSELMWRTVNKLPQTTQRRIRSLTVYDWLPYDWIRLYDGREEYFDVLSTLDQLQHINVSPNIVRGGPYWMVKLSQMPNLKTMTLSMPPRETFTRDELKRAAWRREQGTFATLSQVIDLNDSIPCAHNICARGSNFKTMPSKQEVSTEKWCSDCRQTLEKLRKDAIYLRNLADLNWEMMQRKVPNLGVIFEEIRAEAPTHSKEHPVVGSKTIEDRTYQTTLWGVPQDSPKVRRKREAETNIASMTSKHADVRAHKHPPTIGTKAPVMGSLAETGFAEVHKKGLGRTRTKVEKVVDEAGQREAEESRQRRNINSEVRERQASKEAKKEEARSRQRSKKEIDNARKAARKRASQT